MLFCFVYFVLDDKEFFPFTAGLHIGEFSEGGLSVDHPKNDASFINRSIGTVNTYLFNGVSCLTDASCIDETEGDAVDVDSVFNRVSRGAMNI